MAYSILSGNTSDAFTINAATGVIKVAISAFLDFETAHSFSLAVKIQDNGTPSLSSQATIIISLTDVNEAPVMENQFFSLVEKSVPGTAIGYVLTSDPDKNKILKYTIVGGNENRIFNLDASTGLISVADSSQLTYKSNPLTILIVRVQDNGIDSLPAVAFITISLQKILKDITQVSEIFNESDISVYPNPTADFVNISLGKVTKQPVIIKIFNMKGQEIYASKTTGQEKISIDLVNAKPGAYVTHIDINGESYIKKVIVQK